MPAARAAAMPRGMASFVTVFMSHLVKEVSCFVRPGHSFGSVGQHSNGKPGTPRGVIPIVPDFGLILHDLAEATDLRDSGRVNWNGKRETMRASVWP
jgi:hypothetical protein